MDIKTYKNLVRQIFKTDIVPYIHGKKGIGKTEIHRQIADELGMDLIYLTFGAVEDVGDIIGLQDFKVLENGTKQVEHVAPEWFPEEGNKLIFIDEFNRAKPQILQAMFPFILEGRLHTHKLPENCKIIVAGNPPTDEYDVTDIGDEALLSRFCHIELTPTFDEWAKFETNNNGNYDVVSFFRENQDYLASKVEGFNIKTMIKPDRRNASKLSGFANLEGISETQLRDVACGLLGPDVGLAFIQFRKDNRQRIDAKEVFEKYSTELSNKVKLLAVERDLLSRVAEGVVDLTLAMKVKKSGISKPQAEKIKNVEKFLIDLPDDISFNAVRKLITAGKSYLLTSIGESKELIKKLGVEKKEETAETTKTDKV